MRRKLLLAMAMGMIVVPGMTAQEQGAGQSGRRALLPREREIVLARSAAPASVSARARVLVLTERGFEVADSGSSGIVCLVNRSWPASLEPECFDPEAAESVLPMELYQTEERHKGRPDADITREIDARIADGRFRLPRRPALVYMLSSAQQLVSDDGRPVGKWQPHLMIYYPYLRNADLGLPEQPDMRVGMVSAGGRPYATFVIPVRAFVDPPA